MTAHNYLDVEHYSVESGDVVAVGEHELKMEFAYEAGQDTGKGGIVTLLVDGQQVGTGSTKRTPFKYSMSEDQDIGTDTGTPVTYDYTPPFDFEGTLGEVIVELP